MTNKKILFGKKPLSLENSKEIDKWVTGTKDKISEIDKEKRFTIVIPENLYKKLRIKCAKDDLKLKDFIINILEKNLIE